MYARSTTSKESRLREYLTTENLPSLTPEEINLITDAAGGAKLRAFVSALTNLSHTHIVILIPMIDLFRTGSLIWMRRINGLLKKIPTG